MAKKFNLEENDYKEFLKTEIEIIPVKYFYYLNNDHTFIKSSFNENNYHIYFDDNKTEINRNSNYYKQNIKK